MGQAAQDADDAQRRRRADARDQRLAQHGLARLQTVVAQAAGCRHAGAQIRCAGAGGHAAGRVQQVQPGQQRVGAAGLGECQIHPGGAAGIDRLGRGRDRLQRRIGGGQHRGGPPGRQLGDAAAGEFSLLQAADAVQHDGAEGDADQRAGDRDRQQAERAGHAEGLMNARL